MRVVLLLAGFFCVTLSMAQQVSITGTVSVHNSELETGKRKFVSNALVEDELKSVQPAVTDVNGFFRLVYIGIPERSTVAFTVRKEGMEVVNIDALTAVAGQAEPVRITMAPIGKIDEYRRRLYEIGKTAAEKSLESKVASLNRQITELMGAKKTDNVRIRQLKIELEELQQQRSRIEEQARELARKYAPLNLDDAPPFYKKSFLLFQQGLFDSSLTVLSNLNLPGVVDHIMQERVVLKRLPQEIRERDFAQKALSDTAMKYLELKSDLHQTKMEFDSAIVCMELAYRLDSSAFETIFDYALLLKKLNKFDKSILEFEKVIDIIARNKRINGYKAALYTAFSKVNLANIYTDRNNYPEAENLYNQSLESLYYLRKLNPSGLETDYYSVLSNLGVLLLEKNDITGALTLHIRVVDSLRGMAAKNSFEYKPALAFSLNRLSDVYWRIKDITTARKIIEEAFSIYNELFTQDSLEYRDELAMVYSNMGRIYKALHEPEESEKYYLRSLTIRRQLARKNAYVFNPVVALTLNRLGCLYEDERRYAMADTVFSEAFNIYERLLSEDSISFQSEMAALLLNRGNIYTQTHQWSKAEESYNRSLFIYRKLADKDVRYTAEISDGKFNLGKHYMYTHKYLKAEECLLEANTIMHGLILENQDLFASRLVMTERGLGDLYWELRDLHKAAFHYQAALGVIDGLKKKYQDAEAEKAHLYKDIGSVYRAGRQDSKAEEYYEKSYLIYEQLSRIHKGRYDEDLAGLHINLGQTYENKNELKKAELSYKESVQRYELLYRKDSGRYYSDLIDVYCLAGALFIDLEEYVQAGKLLEMAGAMIVRDTLRCESPDCLERRLNVTGKHAELYSKTRKLELAGRKYREMEELAIKLAKSNSHKSAETLAMAFNNLGIYYMDVDSLGRAEVMLTETARIYAQMPNLTETQKMHNQALMDVNFSRLFFLKKDTAKAEVTLLRARDATEKLAVNNSGSYNYYIAGINNSLIHLYELKGEHAKTEICRLKKNEALQQLANDNPQLYLPDLAYSFDQLGNMYFNQKRDQPAHAAYSMALEIKRRIFREFPEGYEYVDLPTTLYNLGLLKRRASLYAAAEKHMVEAFEMGQKISKKYPEYKDAWFRQSDHLMHLYTEILDSTELGVDSIIIYMGRLIKMYEAMYQFEKSQENIHNLAFYCGNITFHYLVAGKHKEAEQFARKGIATDKKQPWIKSMLALSLMQQGKETEALAIYEQIRHIPLDGNKTVGAICLEHITQVEEAGVKIRNIERAQAVLHGNKN